MPKGFPKIDKDAIRRAEESLKALSSNFDDWIKDEIDKLTLAYDAFKANPTEEGLKGLYSAAHDLKGQGATYDFPLITDIAALLCKLIDGQTLDYAQKHHILVRTHVQAMQAALAQNMKTQDNPAAKALVGELSKRVMALKDAA